MARWETPEVEFLKAQVEQAEKEGTPLKTLFEALDGAEELGGRKAGSISQKWYEIVRLEKEKKRKEIGALSKSTEEVKPTAIRGITPDMPKEKRSKITADELMGLEFDYEILQAFEGLPDFISKTFRKLESLEERVESRPPFDFSTFVSSLIEVGKRLENVEVLEANKRILEKENQTLKERVKNLEEKIERITEEYRLANSWFETFMNSSSINQMMSMGEVKRNMRTTLDRFGTVLRVEFVEELVEPRREERAAI